MRIAVVVTLAALLTVGLALEAAAQRRPMAGPKVDMGAPSNRGIAGQSVPWSGPPTVKFDQPRTGRGPYFQPTPGPFQGSEARRWQQKLDRHWGGIPSDRRVPQIERRFGFPRAPRQQIHVHPQPWPIIECFGTRCQRVFPPIR
ncbi:MAG: hypothetical protein ACOX9R_18550 [Armatimonadota bacterium]|jgi:hypothetical protein